MRTGSKIAIALAAIAASACGTVSDLPPARAAQDVEFLRGCWVSKDMPGGPPIAFLRLLPDGAEGPAYAGPITNVRGGKWDVTTRYAFARDGSKAVVTQTDGAARTFLRTEGPPPESDSHASARVVYSDRGELLTVEGAAETLAIIQRGHELHIWDFERDGCD